MFNAPETESKTSIHSTLITLTLESTFDRSVPFIYSVSPISDPNKHIS
jgi:hypothetical protein